MKKKKLFIVEVRDENGRPKTYRIVKAEDQLDAKELAYYALTDSGVECIRHDIFVYECVGE